MKNWIITLLAALPLLGWAQNDSLPDISPEKPLATTAWDRANTAYINGAYAQAVAIYDSIIAGGEVSHKLYYNLANACFKDGRTGRAILFYNKALRIAPTDKDTRYNLTVTNARVLDKIDQVPQFFAERWIAALGLALSGNTWAWISIAMLALALAGAVCYLLPGRLLRRKAGFWSGIVFAVLFIATVMFSSHARSESLAPTEGIIMRTSVAVKSSPDRAAKDLFVLHEGTKVTVEGELQGWLEVTIADGNKGWIESSAIEMI